MRNPFVLVAIAVFLSLSSCQHDEPLPLPDDKLIKLLMDVHVAEAAMSTLPAGPEKDSLAAVYYGQVMELNEVDREVFDTCLAVLRRNPLKMQQIYEEVGVGLDKIKLGKRDR